MAIELTILGSNSAIPSHGRNPSAQVLRIASHKFLIDCGEGTQMRMNEFGVKKFKINKIFISHLHGDHVFGLPGLLTTMNLLGREAPLALYGPEGISSFIKDIFKWSGALLDYNLEIHERTCKDSEVLFQDDEVIVMGFPLVHRVPTNGYIFIEKEGLRHLDGEKANELNIPFGWRQKLKEGVDYIDADGQTVVSSEEITSPPSSPSSYAYCSDTSMEPAIVKWIAEVNCLYHEATYLHDLKEHAHSRYHSTAKEASEIARAANVGQLLIGHHSSRYADVTPLVDEARALFSNTESVIEGKTYKI